MTSGSVRAGQLYWGDSYVPGLHEAIITLEPDIETSVSSGLDVRYWSVYRVMYAISASSWGYTHTGFTSIHEMTLGDYYTLIGNAELKTLSGSVQNKGMALVDRGRYGARLDRFTRSMIGKWEKQKIEAKGLEGTLWKIKRTVTPFYKPRMLLITGVELDSFPHVKLVAVETIEGQDGMWEAIITVDHLKSIFELVSDMP